MDERIRVLLLGAGGFVGSAMRGQLGEKVDIHATSRRAGPGLSKLDICDTDDVLDAIDHFAPTHIVNLAGIASPAAAQHDPERARELHIHAPVRLATKVAAMYPDCWFMHVGSGMAYGRSALSGQPLDETARLDPLDVYGATKAEGDLALGALAQGGLKCMRLRPFNHTGPAQSPDYAIPAFAAQIAAIEAGLQEPLLLVGNLDSVRDFLHVDDVVDAYCRLIVNSAQIEPGSVFNVASGKGLRIRDALDYLIAQSNVPISVFSDPAKHRPNDLPVVIGDASRLRSATGWSPTHTISAILDDVLAAQRARLA